jgi:hypothetical protein
VDKANKQIEQLKSELKLVKDQRDNLLKLFSKIKKLLEMYGLV